MTCPVGGERFEALVTDVYTTHGGRPDGRPNTYWYMPLPLPECPSNGLVIFAEFTPAQIAVLTRLIATPDYRRLVAEDSTYYRAQWLATRIGLSEQQALWILLRATWQVKPAQGPVGQAMPSVAKARQYQQEFAERVRALPPDPNDGDYIALFPRAANAERELGHFETAAAMLTQMNAWPTEGPSAEWRPFVAALSAVVARHDSYVQPLDMADDTEVPWLCIDPALPNTEFNHTSCDRSTTREAIERNQRMRDEMQRRNPPTPR